MIFQEIDRLLLLILIWEEKHPRSQIPPQEIYFLLSSTQTADLCHYKLGYPLLKGQIKMGFYYWPDFFLNSDYFIVYR